MDLDDCIELKGLISKQKKLLQDLEASEKKVDFNCYLILACICALIAIEGFKLIAIVIVSH